VSERLFMPLAEAGDVSEAGGKAAALARMHLSGISVPEGVVVTTAAYRAFVAHEGLRERIALELTRRPLAELRHEETWDVALRVRGLFLAADWPGELRDSLAMALSPLLTEDSVLAVRSSAPHEDSAHSSFAGLHESIIGVHGLEDAIEAVRSVWASLFTDRALLYHAELGLDASKSMMAVLVQPLVSAERAGVAFTRSPENPKRGAIEAVWGLGEGLVSGRIEPDTWLVERDSGRIAAHRRARREKRLIPGVHGPIETDLADDLRNKAPLSDEEVLDVWRHACRAEDLFGIDIDCEWVIDGQSLLLTQARPIVDRRTDARSVYLASQPHADELERLRAEIEEQILPQMRRAARELASVELSGLDNEALDAEAHQRAEIVTRWREKYRTAMIPFAHGARLLGRLYTDTLRPDDPFEYLTLLVRSADEYAVHRSLLKELGSSAELPTPDDRHSVERQKRFLDAIAPDQRPDAEKLLWLARASWRLRDDDNLYLSLLERETRRVAAEVERRLQSTGPDPALKRAREVLEALDGSSLDSNRPQYTGVVSTRPRQLLGQPAGPGLGTGPARVIRAPQDLLQLAPGDVVVADALEPETAAYAARAAGIVERRGGMLVHGAIVAREHGVPCVTGIKDATALIHEGEQVTVDGFLGIVVLDEV
jgi:phosphoenolpyruvate synthase/pyruvate phosphate dikinase